MRAYLDPSPPWEYLEAWDVGLASMLELNEGRTFYIDGWAKVVNFYTITYHYLNTTTGLFTPTSYSFLGPL